MAVDASGGNHGGVLVIGADGTIGSAVSARLEAAGVRVIRTSRRGTAGSLPLDLATLPGSWTPPAGVASAILCAAISDTARCCAQPKAARIVNVDAPITLARVLTKSGHRVVFLSSNMVFDGTIPRTPADSPRCPRTEYGRMKAEAEEALLTLGDLVTVIRLTKVIHDGMPLLANWRAALAQGEPILPFLDYPLAPVSLCFAAAVVAAASTTDCGGVLQASATHDVTYADVAERLAAMGGISNDLVRPIAARSLHIPLEHVPFHTSLNGNRLHKLLGIASPDPWAALAGCSLAG
jgi:dTDP-4-dehydrorhamnose reductase